MICLVEGLTHRTLKDLHYALPECCRLVVALLRVLVVAQIQLRAERQLGVLGDLQSRMRRQLGRVNCRTLVTLHNEFLVGVPAHVENTARQATMGCGEVVGEILKL